MFFIPCNQPLPRPLNSRITLRIAFGRRMQIILTLIFSPLT